MVFKRKDIFWLMERFNFFPLLNFEENFDFIFLRPDFCRSEITDPVNE